MIFPCLLPIYSVDEHGHHFVTSLFACHASRLPRREEGWKDGTDRVQVDDIQVILGASQKKDAAHSWIHDQRDQEIRRHNE
jgi:hypothetical protein